MPAGNIALVTNNDHKEDLMKDPDIAFCWCIMLSFLVGCGFALYLAYGFFPVSTGIGSDFVACLFYLALSALFISLLLYVSNKVVPNPRNGV